MQVHIWPSRTRSVTAASEAMSVHASYVTSCVGAGTVWKWSKTQTDSNPLSSASRAMRVIVGQCSVVSMPARSIFQPWGTNSPNRMTLTIYARWRDDGCQDGAVTTLLERLERYYDEAPRFSARPEPVGPFTLYVSTGSWPYYARPRLGGAGPFTESDVRALTERQRELGVPGDDRVGCRDDAVARRSVRRGPGSSVHAYPLLVLDTLRVAPVPDGIRLRLVPADDPALPRIQAAVMLGFESAGTAVGTPGPAERDAAAGAQGVAHLRRRLGAGRTVLVVAEDDSGPLAAGSHQPIDGVTELTGIATLPSARRRGIGAAVTAALVADARARGAQTVFLSAGSDEIARVYERVGFRRVGTACAAERG